MRSLSSGAERSSTLCPIWCARSGLRFSPSPDSSSNAAIADPRSQSSGCDDESAPEHPCVRVDGLVENAGLPGRHAAFWLHEVDLASAHKQGGRRRTSGTHPGRNRQSVGRQIGEFAPTDPIDIAQPKPPHRQGGARTDYDARIGRVEGDNVKRLGRRHANAAPLANGIMNYAIVSSEHATVDVNDLAGNGSARN